MTGQPGEGTEVPLRTGIRRSHLEHRPGRQTIQLQLGLEQGQRAIQTAGIQLGVAGIGLPFGISHRALQKRPQG